MPTLMGNNGVQKREIQLQASNETYCLFGQELGISF